jgi:hypothetical protein
MVRRKSLPGKRHFSGDIDKMERANFGMDLPPYYERTVKL